MAQQVGPINDQLAALSSQILPPGLILYYANVDDLREQDVNARSMTQRAMDQLTENVKAVGALESLPLCAKVDGRIEIISGHHRVRAARAADVRTILVMLYEEIDHSRLRAKQLAHNSISGQDDPGLLKRIWDEIDDVTARFEAFIDPRVFDDLPEVVKFKPVDVDFDSYAKRVTFVFLASQAEDIDAAAQAVMATLEHDKIYLASAEHYDLWMQALRKTQLDLDIQAAPTAVAEMARIVLEYLNDDRQAST